MTKQPFNYKPGDKIQDLTFDPPINGVIIRRHDSATNVYHVRLEGGVNDVVIRAHNLKMRAA